MCVCLDSLMYWEIELSLAVFVLPKQHKYYDYNYWKNLLQGKDCCKKKFSSDLNLYAFVANDTMGDHYTFRSNKQR